jgi:hypothetical protein
MLWCSAKPTCAGLHGLLQRGSDTFVLRQRRTEPSTIRAIRLDRRNPRARRLASSIPPDLVFGRDTGLTMFNAPLGVAEPHSHESAARTLLGKKEVLGQLRAVVCTASICFFIGSNAAVNIAIVSLAMCWASLTAFSTPSLINLCCRSRSSAELFTVENA